MVLWGQTREHIELKLELFECKDVRVDITTDGTGLHFRWEINSMFVNIVYLFVSNLYMNTC